MEDEEDATLPVESVEPLEEDPPALEFCLFSRLGLA